MVHVNNDGHSDDDSKYDIDDYNGKMDSEGLLIITDQIGLCSVLSPLFIVSRLCLVCLVPAFTIHALTRPSIWCSD